MQICMACSTKTDESGRFCPECGAVLAAAPVDPGSEATAPLPAEGTPTSSAVAASLVGLTIDGFTIESILGGGSFGTVYRGRQVGLDRIVAIKVPTHEIAADPIMAKRFAREARAASRVHHAGVVAIHAVGELPDGRPYLAMQLVDGQPLDNILTDGPISAQRALAIARQIASALSETHAADVVHRDLKPSNIVWHRDRTGDDRITLVDFGIAVCKPGTADATRLTAGGLIGTPHYMSPEQAQGEVVDARADLYALGCLLHELVTGVPPFEGSGFEVLLAHLGRPPQRPSLTHPGVPEIVDELVLQLLQKRPDDRPQTAAAVVALIDAVLAQLDGGKSAPEPPPAPKPPRAKRKSAQPTTYDKPIAQPPPASRVRWLAFGAAGALALCAASLAAYSLANGRHAQYEREPAENGAAITRREIFRDDGETRLRVWVPETLRPNRMQRIRLELRNKLGARLDAEHVVVTIEDPNGRATGLIARPRQADPDQYGFGHRFAVAGTYKLRVFPPETTSTFEIALDVP